MDQAGDRIRRAKYLDWCSARLAEQFLDLSPEQIYELARPDEVGVAESGDRSAAHATLPLPTHASYATLVQRVTDELLERTPLPTYEQWSEAYEESPERFDVELLGYWKEVVEDPSESDPEGSGGRASPGGGSPSGGPASP